MEHRTMLSAADAVERYPELGSVATMARWRARGAGPAYHRVGVKIYYSRADVESWISSRRVATDDTIEATG